MRANYLMLMNERLTLSPIRCSKHNLSTYTYLAQWLTRRPEVKGNPI